MNKIKLFLYPNAQDHDHDTSLKENYYNTVPLSKEGIKKHCILTGPEEAEYFYMGQFNNDRFHLYKPDMFEHFKGNEEKHICDIEGEGGMPIPTWLHNSIITTMGPLKIYSNIECLFARPTFSHLLLDIIKNRKEEFSFPENKSIGFRGYLNHIIRAMMVHAVHNSEFEKEMHINRKWSGPSKIGSKVQEEFIETILNNSLSLCPRGSGIDSVRLLETCYYGRTPILISDLDYYLVGEGDYDIDFVYRICREDNNPGYIKEKLQELYDEPHEEHARRASLAKKYFDEVVRVYFEDPTAYFLNWLKKK